MLQIESYIVYSISPQVRSRFENALKKITNYIGLHHTTYRRIGFFFSLRLKNN